MTKIEIIEAIKVLAAVLEANKIVDAFQTDDARTVSSIANLKLLELIPKL